MPTPNLSDVETVAKLFGLHPVTVRKKVAAAEWPSLLVGRKIFFTDDHIEQIIALSERPSVRTA